ncbi:MAG: hypothetical protein H6Q89_825 [Myxococcaceae bacterium]|nr:hypothetical protein [Myxococcaceae bacterium]
MTTVVIAGGTGKTGGRLAERLGARFAVRRLGSGTNLLSLSSAEAALAGAQVGVYLARATRSPYRLTQAKQADLELLMADSFARAAARWGVRRILAWRCGADDERLVPLAAAGVPLTVVDSAEELEAALQSEPEHSSRSDALLAPQPGAEPGVCSLQRLPLPAGWTAEQATRAYFEWVAAHLPGVSAVCTGDAWTLRAFGAPMLCLSLIRGRSTRDCAVLSTGGGWLEGAFAGKGHFEFRIVPTPAGPALFTNLIGFVPALPLLLYRLSQAPFHAWVMARFGRWLATK